MSIGCTPRAQTQTRSALLLIGCLAAAALAGCETPGPTSQPKRAPTPMQVAQMQTEPDIAAVVAIYNSTDPWIWTEDRSRVRGIVVGGLYLIGPDDKAVFGDGVIHPKLYLIEKDAEGRQKAVSAKEWSFDVDEALLLRSKKETTFGWGYLLPLDWGDLDLSGREIRMLIVFERSDGLVVKTKSPKHFRVPVGGV